MKRTFLQICALCALLFFAFSQVIGSEDVNLADDVAKNAPKSLGNHDYSPKKPPIWVHSVGQIVSYFDDGILTQGYAALLQNGFFITSSDLVRKDNMDFYPHKIELKMQDDSANSLICIANLEVRAINDFQGIALLSTKSYTDSYCKPMEKSFYQARLYDLFFIDLFRGVSVEKTQKLNLLYPDIKRKFSFEVSEISDARSISYQDTKTKENVIFGYFSKNLDLQKPKFGTPFFTESGNLAGIFVKTARYNYPIILNDSEIKRFLCNIKTDVNLGFWTDEDCLSFQQNVIKNLEDLIKKNDEIIDRSKEILEESEYAK
ncbi:MAG: hypothetical protein E7K04_01305 [Helicobacter sp.]|nr:hypothetical protein [Helicobacter sp.]